MTLGSLLMVLNRIYNGALLCEASDSEQKSALGDLAY